VDNSWEVDGVSQPTVWLDGSVYKMLYVGTGLSGNTAFGYATSADGRAWVKSADNPVFTKLTQSSTGLLWDTGGLASPEAFVAGGPPATLYFTGYPADPPRARLGRAVQSN
jgi:hypothetical protein